MLLAIMNRHGVNSIPELMGNFGFQCHLINSNSYTIGYAMLSKYIKGTNWTSNDCQSVYIQLVPLMYLNSKYLLQSLIGIGTQSGYSDYLLGVVYIPSRIVM